ncbi:MAG: hypothetical protein WDO12_03260 [Pseudomonadota bacterium]
MFKRGRKGRISNELVASSCAAILAVYAAGTWRTRDEARRFGVEGEVRRSARPAQIPAASVPAAVAAAVSQPAFPPPVAVGPRQAPQKLVKAVSKPTPASLPTAAVLPQTPKPAALPTAEPASDDTDAAESALSAPPSRKRWLDGYYTGWGTSPHGDMQVYVRIEDGRITDAGVADCQTRYPCSVINDILLQPIDLQGPDVDRVSRATESGDAYYYGLVRALENATTGTYKSVRP